MRIRTADLIPTDQPRSLMGILRFVPLILRKSPVEPIVVVAARLGADLALRPNSHPGRTVYFVCSGNHRAAAAHICRIRVAARVIESERDLHVLEHGRVSDCGSVTGLVSACWKNSKSGRYLAGGWTEYLRMITDSSSVRFEI